MHGKNNEPLVIVDADAIISFVYIDDENHHRAKQLMQQLVVNDVSLLFPTTAICEAITVLRGKLNRPEDAKRILAKFQSGDFPVQAVDHAILTEAGTLFNPNGSKKKSLLISCSNATFEKHSCPPDTFYCANQLPSKLNEWYSWHHPPN